MLRCFVRERWTNESSECVGVDGCCDAWLVRYDSVRLLLELPPDAFMSALVAHSSVQQPLAAEVTFFVVEKLDTIARLRDSSADDAGDDGSARDSELRGVTGVAVTPLQSDVEVANGRGAGTYQLSLKCAVVVTGGCMAPCPLERKRM